MEGSQSYKRILTFSTIAQHCSCSLDQLRPARSIELSRFVASHRNPNPVIFGRSLLDSTERVREQLAMKQTAKSEQGVPSLNILLTNGRLPVAIDLARQLKKAGHTVFVVDPMPYHGCKFSTAVKKSLRVPAPHDDAAGYIAGVKNAIAAKHIDLIIPVHEEIFHLAECEDREILDRLFAPPFGVLVRLHDKWEFNRFLKRLGLEYPQASLCCNYDDVQRLDRTKEWALKPVLGRALGRVFHLRPNKPLPTASELSISDEEHYTAQEWLYGARYCSYSVLRNGQLCALSIYPVQDTIDGNSCVYFEFVEHLVIQAYIEEISLANPGVSGQLAFDFVETDGGHLVAIECNPCATSGIHLFSGHADLARCMTEPAGTAAAKPGPALVPRDGASRQFAPGMLIVPPRTYATGKEYRRHLKRLIKSRDVTFSVRDVLPLPVLLVEPLVQTCYFKCCQEASGIDIPNMFQADLLWEPVGEHLEKVRRMLKEMAESEEKPITKWKGRG